MAKHSRKKNLPLVYYVDRLSQFFLAKFFKKFNFREEKLKIIKLLGKLVQESFGLGSSIFIFGHRP